MRRRVAGCAGLLVAVWVMGPLVSADGQEWPRLRGPNGQGVSACTSIPVAWAEGDGQWKVELPGGGHSSPVVWGDKVFVTSADAESAKRIIQCRSAKDGSALWTREYPSNPHYLHGLNSYATTTPAVDADRVYVAWATTTDYPVIALDHAGKDVWRRDLGPFKSQHGHGASPMVYEGLVIVANEQLGKSFLVALDAATGDTRWQTDRRTDRAAYSTPCVYQPEGGPPQLIFTSTAHGVASVDPKTGKVNWEAPDVFPERVVSSPVIANGLILGTCGTGGRGRSLVAVRPPADPGAKAEVAWEIKKDAPYVPTGVCHDGLLFVWSEGGVVQCLRPATGEQVWRQRVGGYYYGSPVWVAGRLYALSTHGDVVVLAASETFKELGRTPLGEKSHATPAISGGRMYLRTWSHLICVGG